MLFWSQKYVQIVLTKRFKSTNSRRVSLASTLRPRFLLDISCWLLYSWASACNVTGIDIISQSTLHVSVHPWPSGSSSTRSTLKTIECSCTMVYFCRQSTRSATAHPAISSRNSTMGPGGPISALPSIHPPILPSSFMHPSFLEHRTAHSTHLFKHLWSPRRFAHHCTTSFVSSSPPPSSLSINVGVSALVHSSCGRQLSTPSLTQLLFNVAPNYLRFIG